MNRFVKNGKANFFQLTKMSGPSPEVIPNILRTNLGILGIFGIMESTLIVNIFEPLPATTFLNNQLRDHKMLLTMYVLKVKLNNEMMLLDHPCSDCDYLWIKYYKLDL